MLDVLLAFGVLLSSTASQLRPAGAAIGPGELCLVFGILLMFMREVVRGGPVLTSPLSNLLIFWLLFAVAQCVGTMTGYMLGDRHDSALFMHDLVAYPLVAAVSCLIVVEPGATSRLNRITWMIATFGAAWLLLQVAFGFGFVNFGDYDAWEWDRFRGLSDNSNQLALFCAVMGLVALHLAETARGVGQRSAAVICMIVAVVVGRLTKSDAFLVVLIGAGPIFVALKLKRWLISFERPMRFRSATAWMLVLTLPLLTGYVIYVGATTATELEDAIKGMTKGGGGRDTQETARVRFDNWSRALRRGTDAGLLGLGPGPHLEIPNSILAGRRDSTNDPKHVDHPELGFAPNFEAHNTWLDLFLQGGLMAVLSLWWLLTTALVLTQRSERDALTTLLCGVVLFVTFHMDIRHPIFWFGISLSLVAAAESRRCSMVRAGS